MVLRLTRALRAVADRPASEQSGLAFVRTSERTSAAAAVAAAGRPHAPPVCRFDDSCHKESCHKTEARRLERLFRLATHCVSRLAVIFSYGASIHDKAHIWQDASGTKWV